MGDLVLVKMYNYTRLGGQTWCFLRCYKGPFPILKKVEAHAYKVKLPPKIKYHTISLVSLLKPYHGDEVDLSKGISQGLMGIKE